MVPLVYYCVADDRNGYFYRLLRASLTTLLKNHDGRVLIVADRDIRVPCDRVAVIRKSAGDSFYDSMEWRLCLYNILREFPTNSYPIDMIRVLYMDVDTIVTRPVSTLYADSSRHDGLYCCMEPPHMAIGDESNGKYAMTDAECSEAAATRPRPYNAGVYLADVKNMASIFEKYRAAYRAAVTRFANRPWEQKIGLSDQSALNALIFRGVILPIPFSRDHVQITPEVGVSQPYPTIMHFNGVNRPLMDQFAPPEEDLITIEGVT